MIKTLLKELKQYKKDSILCPSWVVLEVVLEIAIPFLMSIIVDDGVKQGNLDTVYKLGIMMIGAAFISLFAGAMAGKYAASASTGFAKNLRLSMFTKIQDFSFENIDRYSTAGLVTRLMTDVTNVQNAYQMIIRTLVRAPLMLILAMTVIFTTSPTLALIYVGAIIFLAVVLYYVSSHAHPVFIKMFKTYENLNGSIQENINGIRVVKSFVRENYEVNKFSKVSEKIYQLSKKAEKILTYNQPAMQLSMYTIMILISWIGAHMIVSDTLTTGQLMSMFTYTSNILMSLMMISMVFIMVTMSMASAERIVEVLNETSTINNPKKPIYEVTNGAITFNKVNFGYYEGDEKRVLKDINLSIKSGETIGIIGGTGSSKSTLVSLIPRLYETNSGEVLVGGHNVKEYDLEVLRDSVSVVLQKNVLFSGTIKENLRWGNPYASDEQIVHACKLAQADDFVNNFSDKYDTYIEQGGTNVSGGQKQRLCIARALLKNPKILILDDSTSAVDTKTDSLIQKAFKDYIPDVTKIIIAQRISSVEQADKIVVMNNGNIDGVGTHEELLKSNSIYKEVYETQTNGGGDFDEK